MSILSILVSHGKTTLFLRTFHLIRCHSSNRAELRTRSMVRYYTCISSTRWDVAHLSGTPGEVARMMKRTRISYRESPPPKAMLAPFSKMNQSTYEYISFMYVSHTCNLWIDIQRRYSTNSLSGLERYKKQIQETLLTNLKTFSQCATMYLKKRSRVLLQLWNLIRSCRIKRLSAHYITPLPHIYNCTYIDVAASHCTPLYLQTIHRYSLHILDQISREKEIWTGKWKDKSG